ncbi:hypothetical Protein MAMP_02704 [Methylophaga aminisulfidivorans MP]|uniref:Uncharacterized protein n=1 Tax=Methylophaga aminisulfidivorans MP TaxID=1026882 RepID=F5SVY6_9GAMM|nr:hypothetical Protein MAMP_02704 [Methylophaga aminisulfidivorans MP]
MNGLPTQTETGSSPWARGTLLFDEYQQALIRFIPVGTGNTYTYLLVIAY